MKLVGALVNTVEEADCVVCVCIEFGMLLSVVGDIREGGGTDGSGISDELDMGLAFTLIEASDVGETEVTAPTSLGYHRK